MKVLPLEKMDLHKNRMKMLEISRNHAGIIRMGLKNMGIDHATVYGTLEWVCRSINESSGIPGRPGRSIRRQVIPLSKMMT